METENKIGLLSFKFNKMPEDKEFHVYKIEIKNPNWRDTKNLRNLRYKLEQKNKKDKIVPFLYLIEDKDIILSYEKIDDNLQTTEDYEIQSEGKRKFSVRENQDLHAKWAEYYIYRKGIRCKKYFSKKNSLTEKVYDDDNIIVNRVIEYNCKVIDGEVYINLEVKHSILSKKTIYDMIKEGKKVEGLKVKCLWSINKTYRIVKIEDTTILEPSIGGASLYKYWEEKAPERVKNIDKNARCIRLDNDYLYIQESLKQVLTQMDIKKIKGNFSKNINDMLKLNMRERVGIVNKIFEDIKLSISESPVKAEELGYRIINIKDVPNLLIKNDEKISFKEKNRVFKKGCYSLPNEKVKIGILNYQINQKMGRDIIKEIHKVLKDIEFPMSIIKKEFSYKEGDKFSCREIVDEMANEGVKFALVVTPTYNSEDCHYDFQGDSIYDNLKKIFANKKIPSQMICAKKESLDYRIKNVVLGIIAKSGGKSWVLEESMDDIDCFVGIDIQAQEKGIHRPAVVSCFDGQLNDIGYNSLDLVQSGEKINTGNLKNIFEEVLYMYKNKKEVFPKHIMIHRDGFWNEDIDFTKYLEEKGIKIDIVEIRKNIKERVLDLNNNNYNPGLGTFLVKDKEAIIVTTEANLGGAPQPLKLVHIYGGTSMENIIKHVYVLGEVGFGAMRKSRLPITTHYADKMCKNHEFIPKNEILNVPYFL